MALSAEQKTVFYVSFVKREEKEELEEEEKYRQQFRFEEIVRLM